MRFSLKLLIVMPAIAFAALLTPSAGVGADDGRQVVDELCSLCHTAQTRPLERMHLTRAQWAEAVDRMKGYGAQVPPQKLAALLDYLAAKHGPGGATRQKK